MVYLLNYLHLSAYTVIFIAAYYVTLVYRFVPTAFVIGWCLYAFVTVGHDCIHGSFSPYTRVNKMLSFICMNMIRMPREKWKEEHSSHHRDPGSESDNMLLVGGNFFLELKHLLVSQKPTPFIKELPKLPLLCGLCFLPWYCLPVVWISMIWCFMYLSLSPHITDPHLLSWPVEKEKVAEDIALNIFPCSHLYTFLAGGLNIHGCHHKNCKWTRSELMAEAQTEGYKCINTLSDFFKLLWYR